MEEKKEQPKDSEFIVEPLSEEDLEDVSGGEAPTGDCIGGSGCCDGFSSIE